MVVVMGQIIFDFLDFREFCFETSSYINIIAKNYLFIQYLQVSILVIGLILLRNVGSDAYLAKDLRTPPHPPMIQGDSHFPYYGEFL